MISIVFDSGGPGSKPTYSTIDFPLIGDPNSDSGLAMPTPKGSHGPQARKRIVPVGDIIFSATVSFGHQDPGHARAQGLPPSLPRIISKCTFGIRGHRPPRVLGRFLVSLTLLCTFSRRRLWTYRLRVLGLVVRTLSTTNCNPNSAVLGLQSYASPCACHGLASRFHLLPRESIKANSRRCKLCL